MQYNLQLSQESIGDGPEYAGFFSKTQFVDFVLIITTLPTLSVIMIYIHSGLILVDDKCINCSSASKI